MPVHTIDMSGGGADDQWGEAAGALAKAFTPDYKALADGKVRAAQAANAYAGAEANRARAGQYNAAAALDTNKLAAMNAFSEGIANLDLTDDELLTLMMENAAGMGWTGSDVQNWAKTFANTSSTMDLATQERWRGTPFDQTQVGVETGREFDRQTALETEWAKPIITDGNIIGGTGDTRFDQYPGGVAPFGNEVTGGNTIFRPEYGEDGTYTGVDPFTAPKPEAPRGASDLYNYQYRGADGNMVEGLGTLNSAGAPIDSVTGEPLPPNVRRIANTAPSAPDTFNYTWIGEDGTRYQELALIDPVTDRIVNTRGEELPLNGRRIGNTEAESDAPKIGDFKNYTYTDEAGEQQVTPATVNAQNQLVDFNGNRLPINGQFFGTTVQGGSVGEVNEVTQAQGRALDLGGAYARGVEGLNTVVGFDTNTGQFANGGTFPGISGVIGDTIEELVTNSVGGAIGAYTGNRTRSDFDNNFNYRGFQVIEPLLRLRSGAATPEEEVRRYKRYLPQAGEPASLSKQKIIDLNILSISMQKAAEYQGLPLGELAVLAEADPTDERVVAFRAAQRALEQQVRAEWDQTNGGTGGAGGTVSATDDALLKRWGVTR